MRQKIKRMVEEEVTICKCDFCDFETDHNRGCCGSHPVMQCCFCGKDGCKDHRKQYWENEWEDYPDFTACEACIPKVDFCQYVAEQTAGRYDIWRDIVRKIYNNTEEYEHWREDYEVHQKAEKNFKKLSTEDLYGDT